MSKKQRIQRINQMLLEMASGNFFYRLERSNKNDNIEAIGISLNMLAEEIQETLLHQGYINSNSTVVEVIQMSFILDENGYIEMVNQQVCHIFSVLQSDLIGVSFINLLEPINHKIWETTWRAIKEKTFYETSLDLKFITKDHLIIPKTCFVNTFQGKNSTEKKTLITNIQLNSSQDYLESELKRGVINYSNLQKQSKTNQLDLQIKPKLRLSFEDIRKMRKARDIINNSLDKDFPSLKDFALQLGTNEFKLKYGFKELYGTTVHRFLKEERMIKSKMMIQYSGQALKKIAQLTGFKSIAHFSRTFKKRFGYSPSELRKKSQNMDK